MVFVDTDCIIPISHVFHVCFFVLSCVSCLCCVVHIMLIVECHNDSYL